MLPFVLMVQLNSKKPSWVYCSRQYFRLSANVCLALRSVFLQINSNR